MSAVKVDKFTPIRRHDGKWALREERLNWQLENWAVWESAKWDAELAYTLSAGCSSSVDFDQMCAEMDKRCAGITAAAIHSLSIVEQCAVLNKILAAVFRFEREDAQAAWLRARWILAHDLYKRGLV